VLNLPRVQPLVVASLSRPAKPSALDQFTVDLTARARAGQIDPVLGRILRSGRLSTFLRGAVRTTDSDR